MRKLTTYAGKNTSRTTLGLDTLDHPLPTGDTQQFMGLDKTVYIDGTGRNSAQIPG